MMPDWNQKVTPGVKLAEGNKHGFVGVYYDRRKTRFRAEFWHKGKRHRSLSCTTAAEAARHYDKLVRELRGSGYPVNFPVDGERGFIKSVDLEKFCARGHPHEGNMYVRPDGAGQVCRKCQTLAANRMNIRKRQAAGAIE